MQKKILILVDSNPMKKSTSLKKIVTVQIPSENLQKRKTPL
jgi:hypothetical protein